MSKQAQRYLDFKQRVGWYAKAEIRKPIEGDIIVTAVAYMKPVPDVDVDNLAKSFLDGMNQVAYIDDKQVMKLTVEKRWVFDEKEEHSEIEIEAVS